MVLRFPLPEDEGDGKEPLNLLHVAARSSLAEQDLVDAAEAQCSVSVIRA